MEKIVPKSLPHVLKGILIVESGKFLLVKSGTQWNFAWESRIQLKESGIPLTIGIQFQ